MSSVFLSPHHDDETLFGAFTICKERPKVIVVLESHLQEARGNTWTTGWGHLGQNPELTKQMPITDAVRRQETEAAMAALGVINLNDTSRLEFWPFRDDAPDWGAITERIIRACAEADHVYAPSPYPAGGGHEHHNALGQIVIDHVAPTRRTLYDTYVYGTKRITDGTEVEPEPWMVAAKLRALACYRSQIELWPHHFLAEQREYYA